MSDLKPCPFCGGKATLLSDSSEDHPPCHAVYCDKCEARGPWSRSKLEAERLWNLRVPKLTPAQVEAIQGALSILKNYPGMSGVCTHELEEIVRANE